MTLLLAVILLAVALRVYQLGNESVWWDELIGPRHLDAPSLGAFLGQTLEIDRAQTPTYYVLQYGWARTVGESIYTLRFLSILFGVLSVPLLFLLARTIFDDSAGLVAAFCLACSLVHIYYSQELRVYALVSLCALLSAYTFVRAMGANDGRWWWGHLAANALLAWTHMFSVFYFAVEALFLLAFRRKQRIRLVQWGVAHLVIALSLVLWVFSTGVGSIYGVAGYLVPGTWRELVNAFVVFGGGRPTNWDPAGYVLGPFSLDLVLAGVLLVLAAWLGWAILRARPEEKRGTIEDGPPSRFESYCFLAGWLFIPPLILMVVDQFWRPSFVIRYVLHSSLPLYVLVGGAVSTVSKRRLRFALVAGIAAMFAYQSTVLRGPIRPNYRAAAQHIESNRLPGEAVFGLKSFNTECYEFNAGIDHEEMQVIHGQDDMWTAASDACREGSGAWILLWHWDDTTVFEDGLTNRGLAYEQTEHGGIPPVLVYHVSGAS